ncbi:MAG TPA: hypothetical protein VI979_00385 [archaeon]|nr:hypothetical protein [archaeon]
MCEPVALQWTAKADHVLAMVAARNNLRKRTAYPQVPGEIDTTVPDYVNRDRPVEPVYAGRK